MVQAAAVEPPALRGVLPPSLAMEAVARRQCLGLGSEEAEQAMLLCPANLIYASLETVSLDKAPPPPIKVFVRLLANPAGCW